MRQSEIEKQRIVAIMKAVEPAYLATCDGDQPRVRPVTPIVEDDMSIWIGTHSHTRKVKQIEQNPKVCLAFVQPPYSARGEKVAMVIGEAKIIPKIKEKKRFWDLWRRVYKAVDLERLFPGGPKSKEFCLLKIIIKKIEWHEEEGKKKIYEP
ncbi:MAG: pyridoxamine 5'-phosphate oxidase family protein [Candidatus Thermoplasmatota archaeon]